MLVRPAMKRLFCLKAKNGLGRFTPSALRFFPDFVLFDGFIWLWNSLFTRKKNARE